VKRFPYSALAAFLRKDFESRRARNSRYSLRSYAKLLGTSITVLSLFIREERSLAETSVLKILQRLETLYPGIELSHPEIFRLHKNLRGEQRELLSLEETSRLIDWHHLAILSLFECSDFDACASSAARRLGISQRSAESAIETLLEMKLLSKNREGVLQASGRGIMTPSEVSSESIRLNHLQSFDLAKRSVQEDDIESRSCLSVTMAIDPRRLSEAKKRLDKFTDKLAHYLEGGNKTQVYRLSVGLFPLSDRAPTESSRS
jgi:hypothetical protein